MKNKDQIEKYWQAYRATLAPEVRALPQQYIAEQWGDSAEMANELGHLIAAGTKTASCSAVWEWEAEGEPIPAVGLITIVLDGAGRPLCIVEMTEIVVRPYDQVDAQFAFEEGEGDRTLAYWRRVHWDFFSRSLAAIGREPATDMPLVCERFRVIYK